MFSCTHLFLYSLWKTGICSAPFFLRDYCRSTIPVEKLLYLISERKEIYTCTSCMSRNILSFLTCLWVYGTIYC